jgi:septal ring factor EnvC (AmiA/AmiB activator)
MIKTKRDIHEIHSMPCILVHPLFSLSCTSIDRTQDTAVNEREDQYKSQIKEYQIKNDQAAREIQDLRSELTKLQQEKTDNENELNKTVNTLKQEFEKFRSERGKIPFIQFISFNFYLRTKRKDESS